MEKCDEAGGVGEAETAGAKAVSTATAAAPREFNEFRADFLCESPNDRLFSGGQFVVHGSNLYFQQVTLDLRGLRVARSGWHLGECAKGRFVPSQALAMGLCKQQVRHSAELSQENAWRYLRGESLHYNAPFEGGGKPWVLVCHEGFPLGWARFVQGRLKNNLPVGWTVR